jgi:hypothetical protein
MSTTVCQLTPFQKALLKLLQLYVILLAVTLTTIYFSPRKKIILSHNLKPKIQGEHKNTP